MMNTTPEKKFHFIMSIHLLAAALLKLPVRALYPIHKKVFISIYYHHFGYLSK